MKKFDRSNMYIAIITISVIILAIVFPSRLTAEASQIKDFKDVPKSHPNYEIIMEMVEKGYISGYEDGTFKPNDIITRKHASVLISNAVELEPVKSYIVVKGYDKPLDLPEDYVYYEQMKAMIKARLMKTNPDGYIFPDRELTRGEMAQIIAKGFKLDLKVDKHPFTDVAEWSDQYVSALYKAGITSGYEDNTFRESEKLTREHFTIFMYRAMKHLEPVDLDSLTDEEIFSMTNRQLANYMPMYQYEFDYLPSGQTSIFDNFEEHDKEEGLYTRFFDRYIVEGFTSFPLTKENLDKHRIPPIGDTLRELSEDILGLSAKETIDLLNRIYLDGDYVTAEDIPTAKKDFAVYFKYNTGYMFMMVDSKKMRK